MKLKSILLSVIIVLLYAGGASAVNFRFADGTIQNSTLKRNMERNTELLLDELTKACDSGSSLRLSGINIQPRAAARLNGLWASLKFRPVNASYTVRCLNDVQGYQARGLEMDVVPEGANYKQSMLRELTISYNRSGQITGVRLAMENKQISGSIMRKGAGVTEAAERTEILKFVEDLCSYYNEKDTASLNAIYSDDALIITGSIIERNNLGDGPKYLRQTKYTVKSKAEYIAALKRQFANNKRVDVKFSDIHVARHPAKKHIYSVTLIQDYKLDNYSDRGYLFLVWDFSDRERPRISVRNWQDEAYTQANGLPRLSDFHWP